MHLFQLSLTTTIRQNMWILALLMLFLIPTILPYLTPHEDAPNIIAPARAQASWEISWVLLLAWLIYQCCHLGSSNSKSTLGLYFQSKGISGTRQLLEIWLSCSCFLIPLSVIPAIYCIAFTAPYDPVEAKMWTALNLQYSILFFITGASLCALAISTASRFGLTVSYLAIITLALYGLVGVNYLDMMVLLKDSPVIDWLYNFSPQLHLSNLTERLIFKKGPLDASTFGLTISYLFGFSLIAAGISSLTFTTKQSR